MSVKRNKESTGCESISSTVCQRLPLSLSVAMASAADAGAHQASHAHLMMVTN